LTRTVLKADKSAIKQAVDALLALKTAFKEKFGYDHGSKAPPTVAAVTPPQPSGSTGNDLETKVAAQGDLVRQLKADKVRMNRIPNTSEDWHEHEVVPLFKLNLFTGI
jgi:hypothetical protein